MDTAEEVDDDCTRSGCLREANAEHGESKKDTETGARVRFNEEEERLATGGSRFGSQRRKNTVVDRVVEEQDLRGLNKNAEERCEARVVECLYAGSESVRDGLDERCNSEERNQGENGTDDTGREVVDEHFESGANLAGPNCVNLLDEPSTGLHFEDISMLLQVLQRLVDEGNTVLVIEHNLDIIKVSDYIIDVGPEGGKGGGEIVAKGTPEDIVAKDFDRSYTARYLKQELL